jgi:MFS transporter, FSR family, fosmidomycin resistance protein
VSTSSFTGATAPVSNISAQTTTFRILAAISFCHFLNDLMQSVIPAVYPLLRDSYHLDYGQIGLITLTLQLTASLLQPLIGIYTDAKPTPFSLPVGMGFTLVGLILLSSAPSFGAILLAVGMVGIGSSVFHPESSRVARMASGGRHGLAQSLFQVGGNVGTSFGPLLAAYVVVPEGQRSIAWFSPAAMVAIVVLTRVGLWYKRNHHTTAKARPKAAGVDGHPSSRRITLALAVLVSLMFSKFVYMASLSSYYTFFLISRFHLSVRSSQIHLFVFLGAVAAGTMIGGPIGDRIGRKLVIWCSILGILPFTLLLPYASLFWTGPLTVIIGMLLASAFPAIVVYAQELVPGKVGTISGLFFGLAFGLGGLGAALLGQLADSTSIEFVYRVCSVLPALGLLTAFLPNIGGGRGLGRGTPSVRRAS